MKVIFEARMEQCDKRDVVVKVFGHWANCKGKGGDGVIWVGEDRAQRVPSIALPSRALQEYQGLTLLHFGIVLKIAYFTVVGD